MFKRIEALRSVISTKFLSSPREKLGSSESGVEALARDISQEHPLVQIFESANIDILRDWGAIALMVKLRQELKDEGDPSAHLTYVRGYPYCGLTLGRDLTEDTAVSTGWKSRQIRLHSRPFPGEYFEAHEDFIVMTYSRVSLSVKEHDRLLKGRVIVSLIGLEGEWQPLEKTEGFLQHLRDNFAGEIAKSGVERFAQEVTLLRMSLEEQSRLAMRFSGYVADSRYIASPQ